jgi:drug/metabolite transporter (DMT)-like permease
VRAERRVLVGATLGILGVLVLFAPQIGDVAISDSVLVGLVLAMLGALSASFGNMASQHAQKMKLPVIQSNAWGMLYGSLWTGAYALLTGREFGFDWSPGYVLSLLYLVVFGSIIAFGAYLTLVGRIGAHRAGYATVMFPVVALGLSYLFEGLALDLPTVAGSGLVIAGNLLVLGVRMPRKFARRRAAPLAPTVTLD